MDPTLVWVPATLIASGAQVARNAMQRQLTETIGTVGATQVRFLFGLPFACLFLLGVLAVTGEGLPRPDAGFVPFILLGALSQIAATGLMLAAMRQRSFAVVTALLKTEAVQIAVFGFVFLGDRLTALGLSGVVLATFGVVLLSWTSKTAGETRTGGLLPLLLGVASGALFALSAVGYRGGILHLDSGSFLIRATTTLAWGLGLQTVLLCIGLVLFDRAALKASFVHWRASVAAGFVGALASQFWFIGFAVTAAANVRTLALVEILMAQAVSRRLFDHAPSRRELAGMGLVGIGVVALLVGAR